MGGLDRGKEREIWIPLDVEFRGADVAVILIPNRLFAGAQVAMPPGA